MLAAELYETVYLGIVFILTIIVAYKYSHYSYSRLNYEYREPPFLSGILCIFMILFIGIRPVSDVFSDMVGYYYHWDDWNYGAYVGLKFSWDQQNLLFDNLRILMSSRQISVEIFFILISFIYFGLMWWACRRLFPKDTLFAFLICLAAFSTFPYGTNGIKAGSAASIFLMALAYSDKRIISIIFALVSIGFHHSMIMVVACYLIVLFYNNPKFFFVIWLTCLLLAAAHVTYFQALFNSIADEQGQMYLSGQLYGKGFRFDFILYSAIPIIVGYFAIIHKQIKSKLYNILLSIYLMTNSVWLLCMYAEFTNRIAYLSWFLYPIVLIYPFLKENWGTTQYIIASRISIAHLAFTMFMTFVYYS